MNKIPPIVVIGQNYCTSLGIIKALGEAGYRVEVGKRILNKPRFATPEMRSRYVDKAVYLQTGPDNVMIKSIIENFASHLGKKILIPSDDFCASLVDRHLNELSSHFILPNANNEQGAISKLMDKSRQNELAQKIGINVADSIIIKVSKDADIVIPEDTPYPCMIKPNESAGHPKSHIQKSENREELITNISRIAQEQEYDILVEQFIKVEKEYTIPGIAIDSNVIIPAVIEKLETGDGEHKGVTISGIIKPANTLGNIVDNLKSLVKETGFQGIFDIELLQSKDGLFFNEINLRNGAAGYSLTKSGINLPAMYVDYLTDYAGTRQQERFSPGHTFVNEKAALENYISGFRSFRRLKKTIRKADIKFILASDDIKACLRFCLLSSYLIIRTRLYSGRFKYFHKYV